MAREVVLVPKEKYQKLLQSHERILSTNTNAERSVKDSDTVERRKVNELSDVNTETKNEKDYEVSQRDVRNDTFVSRMNNDIEAQRKYINLENVHNKTNNGNEMMEEVQSDISNDHLQKYQSIKEKDLHNQIPRDDTTKLAVYKTTTDMIRRKGKSPAKNRNVLRKRWLKYK
jgi:hypothetical protein